MRWRENATGLVHFVEEDQRWLAVYCTALERYRTQETLERYYTSAKDDAPTCLRCVVLAQYFRRRLTP